MKFEFEVTMRIAKPVAEVFNAVVQPEKLSGYFTATASAPLREGSTVQWSFPEFPGEFPVIVSKVKLNSLIELEWASAEGGYNTHIRMSFQEIDPQITLVTIAESGWHETEKGLKSSYGNCGGWMHMLCCLKGYLEHGINLRKGSFHMDDFPDMK